MGDFERAVMERVPDELAQAGSKVGTAVHNAVLDGGEDTRDIADLLHGTWLAHPLHPVLTDITIGAWLLGGAFDAVGALTDDDSARRTGDTLAAIGTAASLPTALSGLADYSTLTPSTEKPATLHALINDINIVLYLASLKHRWSGRRTRGVLYSALAIAGSTASAWIGGELVYKHKVGVDHSEHFSGPEDWTPVLADAELPERDPRRVETDDGKGVLLYREDGRIHAIGSVCSHFGGPLEDGSIDACYVECPWHNSVFDLRDGSIRHGPATQPQPKFATRTRDGRIEIRLAHS